MDMLLSKLFHAGWFDPLETRLINMARYDRALNSEPWTQTVSIVGHKYWGTL